MMNDSSKMINQPDKYAILLDWIALAFAIVIGSILSIGYSGSIPLPLVGTTIAGLIFVIVAYYREYIVRPQAIIIKDDGVVFHFRLRSDRFALWDDIKGIYSKPGPDQTKWGKGMGC
jgi:hypothetical protein